MMIYRTKHLAAMEAQSDEKVIRVEGGYMIVPIWEYKQWKRGR